MTCGIYKITNEINNKCYIGQSVNIERRWKRHKQIFKNKNDNCYDYPLYRSIRKYGIENFVFEILEDCNKNQLNEREFFYMKYFYSFNPYGYNISRGGKSNKCNFYLTMDDVINIRVLLKNENYLIKDIAKKYNVSDKAIVNFLKRKNEPYKIKDIYKKYAPNKIFDGKKENFGKQKKEYNNIIIYTGNMKNVSIYIKN